MRSLTFLALAALGLTASALPALAGTLFVPQQYPTIQKALDAAKPYDTVLVSAKPKGGVYNEAVTISTPHVVLQGLGNPVLDGTGLGTLVPQPPPFQPYLVYPNGIDIRADSVAVRGLTVQNTNSSIFGASSSAVNVGYTSADHRTYYSFNNTEISNVTLTKNDYGIAVMGYFGPIAAPTLTKGLRLIGDVISGNTSSPYQVFGSANQITGTTGTLISGCQFTNNLATGLTLGAGYYGTPVTQNAQIIGSVFSGNTGDGLDATGSGLVLTANEAAANTAYGIYTSLPSFNPAVTTPGSPNPAASALLFNSIHDNQGGGLYATGTQTISGNSLTHNLGFGLYAYGADYSQVAFNQVTGTGLTGYYYNDGTGIYAEAFPYGITAGAPISITANAVSGNSGDGVFLYAAGSTVSYNTVSANSGIGIHLSDMPSLYVYYGYTASGNTVTQNRAVRNTLFDARDDASADDDLTYNGTTFYGDGGSYGPSLDVWTKNLFGTTDPVGLSK